MGLFSEVKDYILGLLVLVIIGMGIWGIVQRIRMKSRDAEIVSLKTDLATKAQVIAQMQASMEGQNKAVEEWKDAARASQDHAAEARENARQAREDFQTRLAALLLAPVPHDAEGALKWASDNAAAVQSEVKR